MTFFAELLDLICKCFVASFCIWVYSSDFGSTDLFLLLCPCLVLESQSKNGFSRISPFSFFRNDLKVVVSAYLKVLEFITGPFFFGIFFVTGKVSLSFSSGVMYLVYSILVSYMYTGRNSSISFRFSSLLACDCSL